MPREREWGMINSKIIQVVDGVDVRIIGSGFIKINNYLFDDSVIIDDFNIQKLIDALTEAKEYTEIIGNW